jgi:cyclic pyranopterin phosphate synthase
MVDVGGKERTERMARAEALVQMSDELVGRLQEKTLPKGDPFEVARIAGIQAAKRTSDLIPLCHQLPLNHIEVSIEIVEGGTRVQTIARTFAETGVEMEALSAATVAALTLYDMCKSVSKGVVIGPIRLLEKRGGKSGDWKRENDSDE